MPAPSYESLRHLLPSLTLENHRVTSPATWDYNCIAWAVGVTNAWWWPVPGRFWPAEVPRTETLEAFLAALGTRGFAPCSSSVAEDGREKVALYSLAGVPTHAARQLTNGWWTSKLGPSIDIEHATVEAVAGGVYGEPVAFVSRSVARRDALVTESP